MLRHQRVLLAPLPAAPLFRLPLLPVGPRARGSQRIQRTRRFTVLVLSATRNGSTL